MRSLIFCGSRATSIPKTCTVPESGGRKPSRISVVVVLPAPFGPSMPKISPRPTAKAHPVDGAGGAVILLQIAYFDSRHTGFLRIQKIGFSCIVPHELMRERGSVVQQSFDFPVGPFEHRPDLLPLPRADSAAPVFEQAAQRFQSIMNYVRFLFFEE